MHAITMDQVRVKSKPKVATVGSSLKPNSIIETKDLSVYYGDKKAVNGINLSFEDQAVTALIGPSGCGKSTFLRCLNRMNDEIETCRIDGEIYYEGVDIHSPQVNVFEVRKQIGMVFQRPNPFAKSIYRNVAYGPNRHGVKKKAELNQIVEESLKKVALWDEVKDKLHASAFSLSGGQQQRLCMARALAMEPNVLLLDEPASALDPVSTGKIEELISELKEQYTIIIVTHNMQQAARVSDQTAYFYMGQVVEYGETEQIFTNPRHEQTEQYILGHIG